MSDSTKNVKLRLTLDAESVPAGGKIAKGTLDDIEVSAKSAGGALNEVGKAAKDAGDKTSASLDAARDRTADFNSAMLSGEQNMRGLRSGADDLGDAITRYAETETNAAERIRDMVAASAAQQAQWASGEAAANREAEARRAAAEATQAETQARLDSRQSYDALGASAGEYLTEQNALRSAMEQEAVSLNDVAEKRDWYKSALDRSLISTKEFGDATQALDRQEKALQQTTAKAAAEAQNLFGKYAPASAAIAQIEADERKLTAARHEGILSQEKYAEAMNGLNVSRAKWHAEAQGINEVGESLGKLSLDSKNALRSYLQVGRSLLSGDWEGASRNMLQAANSAGVLRGGLAALASGAGVVVGAVLAVVGSIAGMATAYASGYFEQQKFNTSLIATGNFAGTTATEMSALASRIGAATGQYASARQALNGLVGTGKVVGDDLGIATQAAVDLAEITGRSIDQAVASIAGLADDPVRAVRALDEQLHLLTATQYDQIRALEEQGDKQAAATLAMQFASDELGKRRAEVVENLGYMERAWKGVGDMASWAWDRMKSLGREDSLGEVTTQLDKLVEVRDRLMAARDKGAVVGDLSFLNGKIADTTAAIEKLTGKRDELYNQNTVAQAKASDQQWEERIKSTTDALSKQGDRLSEDVLAREIHRRAVGLDTGEARIFEDAVRASVKTQLESADAARASADAKRGLAGQNREAANALREAAAETRLAAQQEREREKAMRDSASALELLDRIMESTAATGGVMRQAISTNAREMAMLEKAVGVLLDQGPPTVEMQQHIADAYDAVTDAASRRVAAAEYELDIVGRLQDQYTTDIRIAGLSADQRRVEIAVENALADARRTHSAEWAAQHEEEIRQTVEQGEAALHLANILSSFEEKNGIFKLTDDIKLMGDALAEAVEKGTDTAGIERMQHALGQMNAQLQIQTLGSFKALLGAAQTFIKEGSKGYKAMETGMAALQIVMDLIAVRAAVTAVLNAGANGDGYTGIARMAAMAAAVAPLLASIGQTLAGIGGGGGAADTSAQQQATQGTGSVLGDAAAKSESIANATEITANATTQLVGINRGMLRALIQLQTGISGASSRLARGEGDTSFPGLSGGAASPLFGAGGMGTANPLKFPDPLSILFGGGQEIKSQGIRVVGGALASLIEDISVGAFQVVKTKGGWFSSSSTKLVFDEFSDDLAGQFQLVLSSMADAVREAARALGLDMDQVNAQIAAYRVEEIRINTKGLTGEEAQKELEAVFSRIFDGLAGSIVPFVAQFQQVGEGLGETLVRVATGVQVMQEAVKQLGFALDETDPEKYAQASERLIEMAGGLENFITGMSSFVGNFATDQHKFEVAQAAMTSAFEQYGLVLPTTKEGMWDLMQTLDGTTEAGAEQIAMLLELSDTAKDYYTQLEKQQKRTSDLWTAYFARFHSDAERAQASFDEKSQNATREFGDIGQNVGDFTGEGGAAAFREVFEKMMPTLSDEAIVQWLEAAQALGILIDASTAAGVAVGQTAAQLKTVNDILAKNEWNLATAGMSEADQTIRRVNDSFEAMRLQLEANAATAEQYAQLEEQRLRTMRQQYDAFINTFRGDTTTPDGSTASTTGEAWSQGAVWVQQQIETANALAIAAGMTGASAEDIELIWARVHDNIAATQARLEKDYQDFAAQFRPDATLATGADAQNMDQARAEAAAWEADMVRQLNERAIAAGRVGAAEEDLINVHNMAADAIRRAAERIAEALVQYNDFINGIRRQNGEFSQFQQDQQDATSWYNDAIAKATALAHAAGLAGIAEGDLGAIELRVTQMREAAYRALVQSATSIVGQLQGAAAGSLDGINAQIATLEGAAGNLGGTVEDTAQRWLDAIRTVNDFLNSILLNQQLTTLTPEQQLAEAQAQYQAMLAAAQGGDASAAAALPQMVQQLLGLGRDFYSSGDQYQALFDQLMADLRGLGNVANPGDTGPTQTYGPSPALIALYEQRDALMAQQEADHRAELNQQLIGFLTDLARDSGQSLAELADSIGLNMHDFVVGLGIDVDHMTTETTLQLAELARTLGRSVFDLADSVGISLGDLADRQSLLNQAVQQTISGLPSESADALQAYFDAVTNATTEADANAAIADLIAQINLQPDDIRAQLAPFFEGILPPQSLGQLDYLGTISEASIDTKEFARQQVDQLLRVAAASEDSQAQLVTANDALSRIADNLRSANEAAGIPSYEVGTGYVPRTGLANIHQGEAIFPSPVASWLRSNGFPVARGGAGIDKELAEEMRAVVAAVRAMHSDNNSGHNNTKSAVTAGAQSNAQAQGKTASTVAAALAAAKSRGGR